MKKIMKKIKSIPSQIIKEIQLFYMLYYTKKILKDNLYKKKV